MKRVAFLLTFAFASMAFAQDLSQKITFQCRAMPADQVLKQLTAATKVPMSASQATASEILVISVTDAPVGALMKQIAVVTDGEWSNNGGSYSLDPNGAKRTTEDQADAKEVGAKVLQMFRDLKTRDLPPGPLTLLGEQDLTSIGKLQPGDRMVFSTNPTASQMAINGVDDEFVSAIFEKTEINNGAAQANTQGGEQRQQPQPSKIDLAVSNLDNTLNVRLVGYDEQGREILAQAEDLSIKRTPQATTVPDALDKADSDKVDMSKLTKAIEDAGFDSYSAKVKDFDKDTLDAILHPDKNDPLSFFATDALIQRAAECNEQLVADLPDSIVVDRSETAKGYLDEECARGNLQAKEDHGWMLISPADPAENRAIRANRPALATLVQAANKKTDACLTDMALFAIAEGHPPMGQDGDVADASTPYLRLFIPEWRDFVAAENRFDLLAFYGFLSADQKNALMSGNLVRIGDLSEDARNALNYVAYGAYARYRVEPAPQSRQTPPRVIFPGLVVPNQQGRRQPQQRRRMFLGQASYLVDPTEAFPQGIPPEAYVKLPMNSTRPASNGVGGLNRFAFEFHFSPEVWFEQAIEEPQGGP